MTHDVIHSLPKCPDNLIFHFFGKLEERYGEDRTIITIFGNALRLSFLDKSILDGLKSSNGTIIHSAVAKVGLEDFTITISFGRDLVRSVSGGHSVEPSLYADHLRISAPDKSKIPPDFAYELSQIVENELLSHVSPLPSTEGEPRGLSELVSTHHQLIGALRQQIGVIGKDFAIAHREVEADRAQRRADLELEFEERGRTLENEHALKLERIALKEQELEAHRKQLDDRDNTHARRELRKDLKTQLESYRKQFTLTQGTRNLRRPVMWTVIIIELLCLSAIWYLFTAFPTLTPVWDKIIFGIKSAGLTIFAIGTAVWYLKWLTQWSTRHAEAEFQLKQLELDMDRASWVVETAFEWKSSQESSIPQPLLDAISRNLFLAGDARTELLESPADHLASALLGSASNLKLKLGQHEIIYDRKGLKKTQQSTNSGQ